MLIRVAVKVSDPLKRFKKIKNRDGTAFVINCKYEKLHIFCFICGRLGHSESFCEWLFTSDTISIQREWGTWADWWDILQDNGKWLHFASGTDSEEKHWTFPTVGIDRNNCHGKETFQFGTHGVGVDNQQENPIQFETQEAGTRNPQKDLVRFKLHEVCARNQYNDPGRSFGDNSRCNLGPPLNRNPLHKIIGVASSLSPMQEENYKITHDY